MDTVLPDVRREDGQGGDFVIGILFTAGLVVGIVIGLAKIAASKNGRR